MTRESKEIQRPISRVSPAKRLGAKKIQTDRGPAAETEPNRLYPKRIAAWKPPMGDSGSMGHEGNEAGDRADHIFEGTHHGIGTGLLVRHWLLCRGRRRRLGRGLRYLCSLLGFHGWLTLR